MIAEDYEPSFPLGDPMRHISALILLVGLLILPTQAHAGRFISWTSEIAAHDPRLSLNADALLQWLMALLGL